MINRKSKILIISPTLEDPQSVTLFEEILDNGGCPLMVSLQDRMGEKIHEIGISKDEMFFDIDLNSVKAVFVRCLNLDVPASIPPLLNQTEFHYWRAKFIKENIKMNVFFSLLDMLQRKGVLIVNKPESFFHHNAKAQFFYKLAENGLPVPFTISTNDKKYFMKNSEGREFVVKAAYGVGGTRKLKISDLKNKEELLYCPAIFQEEIKGNTIRVHTVGEKVVLALKIFADDIDSRTETKGFEVYKLNEAHEKIIIEANKLLGIHFSAWDVIVAADKIFLLDCNTGPYIWWISPAYARFVMKQLAKFLTAYVNTDDLNKANKSTSRADEFAFNRVNKFEDKLLPLIDDLAKSWKTKLRIRN